jgi:8-oxo-dGTP pyrophosphatase MutT (NUDIX family)
MGARVVDLTSASELVRSHIQGRPPRQLKGSRRAAVSIVLFEQSAATGFVLIKRANRGRNAGQWALPGGKVEAGETGLEAALREAQEEVDLPAVGVEVVGQLDDLSAATGFIISPFVLVAPTGWCPEAVAEEVQAVHVFDLSVLRRDDVVHWVAQEDGTQWLQMRLNRRAHVHAPTGAILLQFRELALFGRELDVTALIQPGFTHT